MDTVVNKDSIMSCMQDVGELVSEGSEAMKAVFERIELRVDNAPVEELLELVEHLEELAEQMLFAK